MKVESPNPTPPDSVRDFLAELLAEQRRLDTPVARFAAAHDAGSQLSALSSQLIPLTKPGPGEQYAFEVDLDACSGCKACVVACHALNGLEDSESWRDVGLVHGGSRAAPFQQTVTTACHHCADPGCLNGCPVLAYEKDPITGIVRHLDDQCIGCQYCILKCPYDVPKYNDRLGIVRKCDMCHQRLAEGEAPACVQACPTEAIKIVKVSITVNGAAPQADTTQFLPQAPDPHYTQPTTRYVSKQPLPENALASDAAALRPQPPHWPLVALLMFMPMAIGCGVADKILNLHTNALAITGWVAGAVGLGLAGLHLGQPLRAWKIFLNLKKSWFSREAVAFGLWFPLASTYLAARLDWLPLPAGPLRSALAAGTAVVGIGALFCSVMIYVDTRRVFWRFANTAPRFFGSAVLLGLASALAAPGAPLVLGYVLAVATLLKLAFEARALAPLQELDDGTHPPARQTARLLAGPLQPANALRLFCGITGGVLLPFMVAASSAPQVAAWFALGLVVCGELAERYLFFRAVDAPKMPGLPRK